MMSFQENMQKKTEALRKRFNELDKDKDGFVTSKEFEEELINQGFPKCLASKFMLKFDLDKDGKITEQEFIQTLTCTDDNAISSKSE
ncbi:unnamed protein product [Schistosoma turkestanicum]|nr:unnamed protein product [Schistosoma turkestanicum]